MLAALGKEPLNRHSLAGQFGHRSVSGALRKAISILLQNEWIEYTIPEKPNSRLQKYRLTLAGERALKERFGGGGQMTPQVARVLGAARSNCYFADLQVAAGLKDRGHFLKTHLEPLLLAGWIERTIPDKPRSSKQKYRLTPAGAHFLTNVDGFVRLQRATTKRGRQP